MSRSNPDADGGPTNLSSPALQPTQTTYSYRTERIADELSPQAIKEFLDVTRNGFTETNPQWDTGHSFHTTKTSIRLSHRDFRHFAFYDGVKVFREGPLVPTLKPEYGYVGTFPAVPRLSASDISKYGAKAIGATAPTNSNANLSQALGELIVDALPRVAGLTLLNSKNGILNSIGGEYLNYAFGIVPLISDVESVAKAVINSSRLIRQYKRDSGKLVRRRYTFPLEVESSTQENIGHDRYVFDGYDSWTDSPWYAGVTENLVSSVSKQTEIRKKTWFAGAFMYHLEADDSVIGKLNRFEELANHLLGTRVTPSTLWELTPWSWFGDWLGTIGDVLHTSDLLSSDGLVMKYGYLMRHTLHHDTYIMPSGKTFSGGVKTGPVSYRLSRETKERVQATPYGFGLKPSIDFNAKQWAILGALGLTKAPRSLF